MECRYRPSCPDVPSEILIYALGHNDEAFYTQANKLAKAFINNFKKYEAGVSQAILDAAPIVKENTPA
ncbi:MAG: hypothetical protein R2795_24665 [Saprospiraceae bacterium]